MGPIVISESDFSNIVLITLIVANLCSFSKLTNKELGELITEATVYLECQMTKAKIEKILEEKDKAEKAKNN